VAYSEFGKGGHGERAEREPITGVWRSAPLKLKYFLLLNVQWKPQIRPFFLKLGNAESHRYLRCF